MAAVTEMIGEPAATKPMDLKSKPDSDSRFNIQKLVDMFSKLNPSAKEFFPSSYTQDRHKTDNYVSANNLWPIAGNELSGDKNCDPNNWKKRNIFYQGNRRSNGRSFRPQQEDSIRRTVYVSDIDQHFTEEQLAGLFSSCGQVVDCRVCGDPRSVLRFAFVEFSDEEGARAALNLNGTVLGYYPVRVLPSKTSILPVNPTFLPMSDDEREMCSRTVYCTNIDKQISQVEVKNLFESLCGKIARLRLLRDHLSSTRIAFIEFALAESAIIALNCSGMILGNQPIRISPSKTPVRPRVSRPTLN